MRQHGRCFDCQHARRAHRELKGYVFLVCTVTDCPCECFKDPRDAVSLGDLVDAQLQQLLEDKDE